MATEGGKIPGFLRLPPELRNKVYDLLPELHPYNLVFRFEPHCEGFDVDGTITALSPERFRGPQQPALSRTCRQIRSEALPVFYGKAKLKNDTREAVTLGSNPGWWTNSVPWKAAAIDISEVMICCKIDGSYQYWGDQQEFTDWMNIQSADHWLNIILQGEVIAKLCSCHLKPILDSQVIHHNDGLDVSPPIVRARKWVERSKIAMALEWIEGTMASSLMEGTEDEEKCATCDGFVEHKKHEN